MLYSSVDFILLSLLEVGYFVALSGFFLATKTLLINDPSGISGVGSRLWG